MNSFLKKLIITGMGTGYLRPAPGTWASAAVCAIFLAVALVADDRRICLNGTMIVVAVLATTGCIMLGSFAENTYGRKDPSFCTLDEFAGQAVALIMLPIEGPGRSTLLAVGTAFGLFRAFDIVKPWPARSLEKLPQGWGIVTDDLIAGVYANLLAQLILRFLLHLS